MIGNGLLRWGHFQVKVHYIQLHGWHKVTCVVKNSCLIPETKHGNNPASGFTLDADLSFCLPLAVPDVEVKGESAQYFLLVQGSEDAGSEACRVRLLHSDGQINGTAAMATVSDLLRVKSSSSSSGILFCSHKSVCVHDLVCLCACVPMSLSILVLWLLKSWWHHLIVCLRGFRKCFLDLIIMLQRLKTLREKRPLCHRFPLAINH